MEKWLASLSKNSIAFLAIFAGIVVIILLNMPHTVCKSQLEIFHKNETGFLFLDPEIKAIKITGFNKLNNFCKHTNSPGGCYELFLKLRHLHNDLTNLPKDCSDEVSEIKPVKEAIWQMLTLMVQIAWGEEPPATFFDKLGWLDYAAMNLFCDYSDIAKSYYGNEAWKKFRIHLQKTLPGAEGLTPGRVWEASILSTRCSNYR